MPAIVKIAPFYIVMIMITTLRYIVVIIITAVRFVVVDFTLIVRTYLTANCEKSFSLHTILNQKQHSTRGPTTA